MLRKNANHSLLNRSFVLKFGSAVVSSFLSRAVLSTELDKNRSHTLLIMASNYYSLYVSLTLIALMADITSVIQRA